MSESSLLEHATLRRGNLNSELAQNLSFRVYTTSNVGFFYILIFNKHGHHNNNYFRNYRYCARIWHRQNHRKKQHL
ncbi:Rpn family recombination-promoting nuclease/putative transposase [Flavobacterium sp. HJJ]|uniref:Rpn family recombination-promoting nuclease/putative transposase n=1 Tax=Flavobacterium TaxID=237 RepID=UPI003977A9E8